MSALVWLGRKALVKGAGRVLRRPDPVPVVAAAPQAPQPREKTGPSIEHGVYLAAAVATTALASTGDKRWQYAVKPLLGPALGARVWRSFRRGRIDGADTALLLTGIAAATVGDVFMVDPDDDRRLVLGAESFRVMQTAYTSVLRRAGARPTAATALPQAGAAAAGAGVLFWRLPQVAGPLTGYSASLGLTGTLAADPGLVDADDRPATRGGIVRPRVADERTWLQSGSLLFSASDATIVARRAFLNSEKLRRAAEAAVIAGYAAGHLMLLEGLLRLRRR